LSLDALSPFVLIRLAHSDDPIRLVVSSLLFFFLFLLHRIDSVYRIVHTRTLHPNYSPNISRGHSLRLGPQKLDVFVAVQITHSSTIMAYFHQLYAIDQKTLLFIFIVSVLILHLSLCPCLTLPPPLFWACFPLCAFVLQCHPS
jgi:hypothetical protein